jgi:hypothetical protein
MIIKFVFQIVCPACFEKYLSKVFSNWGGGGVEPRQPWVPWKEQRRTARRMKNTRYL